MLRGSHRFGFIDNLQETKHFITFSYHKAEDNVPFVIYSKKTSKTAHFNKILDRAGLPPMDPIGTVGKDYLCIFRPDKYDLSGLEVLIKKGSIPEGVVPENNPIIYTLSIKEK